MRVVGSVLSVQSSKKEVGMRKAPNARRRALHLLEVYLRQAQVLQAVRGTCQVDDELAEMKRAVKDAEAGKGGMVLFRRRRHLPQLLWCTLMPIMQQYTGMNAFTFYAPQIFITLGMGQKASLLGILIVSAVNLAATVFAIYAVDKCGHQTLSLAPGSQSWLMACIKR